MTQRAVTHDEILLPMERRQSNTRTVAGSNRIYRHNSILARGNKRPLWRGSSLPLGCVAAPNSANIHDFASAAHSSGSKLPRHKSTLLAR
ncbi:hypothetical protein FQ192_29825 [Pseudomonas sp. ANT_J12]|nr:hypothetical protein FQ192_29825 [Pseudomonas sp. ANT_J12]